jgi:hypothetical protein
MQQAKHKAMSYDRMEEKEKQLKAEVEKLLAQAAETDAAEDALYGKGNRGDELTGEMARRESRLRKIAEAKTALEREARERAEAAKKVAEVKLQERLKKEQERGKKFGGHPPRISDSRSGSAIHGGVSVHAGRDRHQICKTAAPVTEPEQLRRAFRPEYQRVVPGTDDSVRRGRAPDRRPGVRSTLSRRAEPSGHWQPAHFP